MGGDDADLVTEILLCYYYEERTHRFCFITDTNKFCFMKTHI